MRGHGERRAARVAEQPQEGDNSSERMCRKISGIGLAGGAGIGVRRGVVAGGRLRWRISGVSVKSGSLPFNRVDGTGGRSLCSPACVGEEGSNAGEVPRALSYVRHWQEATCS